MGKAREMILTVDGEYILVSSASSDRYWETATESISTGCCSGSDKLSTGILKMLSILRPVHFTNSRARPLRNWSAFTLKFRSLSSQSLVNFQFSLPNR